MKRFIPRWRIAALAAAIGLVVLVITARASPNPPNLLTLSGLAACYDTGFSTEEDFMSRGPRPPDGNPWISDGDLLSTTGVVCARNRELLAVFAPPGTPSLPDLGLDAVDVISIEPDQAVFSTELNDPFNRFKGGDLLTTDGVVIPNVALLAAFGVNYDLGLDALHFIGQTSDVTRFLAFARQKTRDDWLRAPGALPQALREFSVDIWFSIEGKATTPDGGTIQDGDLLAAVTGTIVLRQENLLAPPIPAGLPARGAGFGLDAVSANCTGDRSTIRFSTEIGYQSPLTPTLRFSSGDLMSLGGTVVKRNRDLVNAFVPLANDLGLDAVTFPSERLQCGPASARFWSYLSLILQSFQQR